MLGEVQETGEGNRRKGGMVAKRKERMGRETITTKQLSVQ